MENAAFKAVNAGRTELLGLFITAQSLMAFACFIIARMEIIQNAAIQNIFGLGLTLII